MKRNIKFVKDNKIFTKIDALINTDGAQYAHHFSVICNLCKIIHKSNVLLLYPKLYLTFFFIFAALFIAFKVFLNAASFCDSSKSNTCTISKFPKVVIFFTIFQRIFIYFSNYFYIILGIILTINLTFKPFKIPFFCLPPLRKNNIFYTLFYSYKSSSLALFLISVSNKS